jgi:hypothetical protein
MDPNINFATKSVTRVVTLELIDPSGDVAPLETELSYNPQDPFAVSATFLTLAGRVRWTFGRDLLVDGLTEPTGDGDVHVWPCVDGNGKHVIIIELCSPDGEALVQGAVADITAFVDSMVLAVAPGTEGHYLDLDFTISAILAAEAA